MNELQIFDYNGSEVRTVQKDGETWFVLKDVCQVLGLGSPHKVSERLDEDERNQIPVTDSLGRPQETTIINESGLYSVILRSDKPEAKPFRKWVTSEVLPSIRKTGAYLTPEMAAALEKLLPFLDSLEQLPTFLELLEELEARVAALEQVGASPDRLALPAAAPDEAETVPGPQARRRWMRTASEKLNLLSARFGLSRNEVLHQLYQILEKQCCVSLNEERFRVMEEYELPECSMLTTVFYTPGLRTFMQRTMDYNLAPENRGW